MKLMALLFSILFATATSFAGERCERLLIGVPSYAHMPHSELVARAQAKVAHLDSNGDHKTPRAFKAAVKNLWNGERAPQVIESVYLPKGAKLIGHQLRYAQEAGAVKLPGIGMSELRVEISPGVETNIGVQTNALLDNEKRNVKTFVRENAEAVVIWLHGGGTDTTGHSTAQTAMGALSQFGIDVISLDLPWHAEGPAVSPENAKQVLEEIRAFTKRYISPSGKKVILAGHSMGGVFSDIYLRSYPRGSDDLISAVIPLSTVADVLPGAGILEKERLDAEITTANLKNNNIPEKERYLGESLLRQGKLSPVCEMYCQVMVSYFTDWNPNHDRSKYLPSLFIIGEGDQLYQGREKQYEDYVGSIPNSKLEVIGDRYSLKAQAPSPSSLEKPGHIMFETRPHIEFADSVDAKTREAIFRAKEIKPEPNKKDQFTFTAADFERLKKEGLVKVNPSVQLTDMNISEVYLMMRDFVGSVIGKSLGKMKVTPSSSSMVSVLGYMNNNLAFREFANTYIMQYWEPTAAHVRVSQQVAEINIRLAKLNPAKGTSLSEEQSREREALFAQREKLVAILKPTLKTQNGENLTPVERIDSEISKLNKETIELEKEYAATRAKFLDGYVTTLDRATKEILALAPLIHGGKVDRQRIELEKTFQELQDAMMKSSSLVSQFLYNDWNGESFNPKLFERVPVQLEYAMKKYNALVAEYKRVEQLYKRTIIREVIAGKAHIQFSHSNSSQELEDAEYKLRLAVDAYKDNVRYITPGRRKLDNLSYEIAHVSTRILELNRQKATIADDPYRILRETTLSELLNMNPEQFLQNRSENEKRLQQFMSIWNSYYWGARLTVGQDADMGD